MELRATRELRRNEQLARAGAKKAGGGAPAQARQSSGRAPADRVSLSRQAVSWLEEQNRKMWEYHQQREQRRQERMEDKLSALESSKGQLDMLGRKLKVMDKCQKIAASIMRGDRVPPQDLLYLMEHDQAGYKLAMAMRRPNDDPKDCESVLDEDDRPHAEESGGGESGPAPAASAEAGPAPGGGGEGAE